LTGGACIVTGALVGAAVVVTVAFPEALPFSIPRKTALQI